MKKQTTLKVSAVILMSVVFLGSNPCTAQPINSQIPDLQSYLPGGAVQIQGHLGDQIDLCIAQRIKRQDVPHLIEPFKHRTEHNLWQSEFWGKWIQSAIGAYKYNHDPELRTIIDNAVTGLLATQTEDGYIGNYAPDAQLNHWDIWGRKYTLLGLMAYYDISKDTKALHAACRVADHLLTQVGPGKANIVQTGNYRGMPSSSILEPMVKLYRLTGNTQYFDFAKYIVAQWETDQGPKLISKALAGVDVADRFPHPQSWWSVENGQKAYEMMSCYEGLLDLYRLTGTPQYLEAAKKAVDNIIHTEINVAGSGTAFECFYHGVPQQTRPTYHTMETCVTFTWLKLCSNLLRITGESQYADQIEVTLYNALLASMKADGSQIAKYSPLEGVRQAGEEQCGMHINCCNANGPRGFALVPRIAVQSHKDAIFVNLYGSSQSQVQLPGKQTVTLTQTSTYPKTDTVTLTVKTDSPQPFTLALRIPGWSQATTLSINQKPVNKIQPGAYKSITRTWQNNDQVTIQFDLTGRLIRLDEYQAIQRGPILLARDSRFQDGFVDEAAVIQQQNGRVELTPVPSQDSMWMCFTVPMVMGADLEGHYRIPKPILMCDFASAGNTWDHTTRYRVWLRQTLNVMNQPYKGY